MGLKRYGYSRCNRSDLAYRGRVRNARDYTGEDARRHRADQGEGANPLRFVEST